MGNIEEKVVLEPFEIENRENGVCYNSVDCKKLLTFAESASDVANEVK